MGDSPLTRPHAVILPVVEEDIPTILRPPPLFPLLHSLALRVKHTVYLCIARTVRGKKPRTE